MSIDQVTRQRIDEVIASDDVVLFMKGSRSAPQCGFSATVIGLLDGLVADYTTFDVLSDSSLREGIKAYSNWPTIPQLYVRGEFLGGCDIIQELAGTGELAKSLNVEPPEGTAPPEVTITPAAAKAVRDSASNMPSDHELHLSIDARFQNKLYHSPPAPGEICIESGGLTLYLDPQSAGRANGVVIDAVDTGPGPAFRIDNPSAPGGDVEQLTARELKQRLDAGEAMEFFDVRTPEERAKASISGARFLTPEEAQRIEGLPKDTPLVFHCHHGGRSQAAAEHFSGLGFSRVSNLVGGIDSWSQEVDPSVPRY